MLKKGYTLTEVIIVITIVGVLSSVSFEITESLKQESEIIVTQQEERIEKIENQLEEYCSIVNC